MTVAGMGDEGGDAYRRNVMALATQIDEFAAQHDVYVHAGRPTSAVLVHVGHIVDFRSLLPLVVLLPLDGVHVPPQAAEVNAHTGGDAHLALTPHRVAQLQACTKVGGVGRAVHLQVAAIFIVDGIGILVLERGLAVVHIDFEPHTLIFQVKTASKHGATFQVIAQRTRGHHAAHTDVEAGTPTGI